MNDMLKNKKKIIIKTKNKLKKLNKFILINYSE